VTDVVRLIGVRDTALSVDEVWSSVADAAAGGTVLFIGTVRERDSGRVVSELGYTAHPSVEAELRRVAEKVVADFPVHALAAVHRVGDLAVGELAVIVAVACPHRAEAFAACRRLIDELKATVPIWKHQQFVEGSDEWVGLP